MAEVNIPVEETGPTDPSLTEGKETDHFKEAEEKPNLVSKTRPIFLINS